MALISQGNSAERDRCRQALLRFGGAACLALMLTACAYSPLGPLPKSVPDVPAATLADEPFAWGFSSSSYQFEDPDVHPGEAAYFRTDWDLMVAQGGAPEKGNALFSWSEFERDVEALRKIGVTHYRFSIEWARVEPRPGEFNQAAIRGYARMAQKLREAGIEPVVCLWHFTFPDWLTDPADPKKTNWLHPLAEKRWPVYVDQIVRATSPYARFYAPQNEPNGQIATAYLTGMWPPRMIGAFGTYRNAIHASARMFRSAADIVKRHRPDALVLSVEALPWWEPGIFDPFGIIYRTMLHQNYDHLDLVYDVCDILGINYYYSLHTGVFALLGEGFRQGAKYSMMGWRINPRGIYDQIRTVSERYGRPVMITENGVATLDDPKRIRYMAEHLNEVRRAINDGYDVRGYLGWSLVDNYEWHYGYEARFGVSHMNPTTLVRELKPSAYFYRDLIRFARRHGVVPETTLEPTKTE